MKNLFILSFLFLLYSCGNNAPSPDVESPIPDTGTTEISTIDETNEMEETPEAKVDNMEDLYGYYVGMFNSEKVGKGKHPTWSNKINISIDSVDGEGVIGHSVVAGNDRPFMGTIKSYKENEYYIEAEEPGDDKYDGKFSFTILAKDKIIQGKWIANDKNLAVIERSYKLKKKDFKYNPELNLKDLPYTEIYDTYDEETGEMEMLTVDLANLNASTQVLKKEDVENMFQGDLEVMRNSIYAKHGYSFKNRRIRYIFNYVDWYIPVHTDIRNQLTELEKKNIDLIKRYETHADKYYDSFGR